MKLQRKLTLVVPWHGSRDFPNARIRADSSPLPASAAIRLGRPRLPEPPVAALAVPVRPFRSLPSRGAPVRRGAVRQLDRTFLMAA